MTTATATHAGTRRDGGLRVLVGAALAAIVIGLLITLVGGVRDGQAAGLGALVGTVLTVGVFAFGAFTVHVVANVMPTMSLLFALLTYTLQLALMALAFVALDRSEAFGDTLAAGWLAAAVIAVTACWLVAQIVLTTRRRIPVYDLGRDDADGGAA